MAGTVFNYPAVTTLPSNGLTIRGVPYPQVHSGDVFFVGNAASLTQRGQVVGADTNPGTFNRPLATLGAALGKCTANRGDIIFVKPGHIETLTAAGGITQSTAGVSVIGLGTYNTRPKFILGTIATTTYLVSGAHSFISNLWLQANFSNVATAFNVTAVGCTIDNCRFSNAGTNLDFLACITASGAANTADGLTVTNCNWTTVDTDDFGLINIANSLTDLTVIGNHMVTTSAQAVAASCANLINCAAGAVLINADIGWNRVQNLMTQGELLISNNGSTSTGFCYNNYVQHADVTGTHDLGADGTGLSLFQNLSVSTNILSGFVLPAVDVNN